MCFFLLLLLIAIETMTAKTGNFKSFTVFINMLENAINQVMFNLHSIILCIKFNSIRFRKAVQSVLIYLLTMISKHYVENGRVKQLISHNNQQTHN